MKIFLVLVACAVGGWYWFVGGRQISESDVRSYYTKELLFLDDGNSKEMCASLDEKYSSRMIQISAAGRVVEETDKAKSCQAIEALVETVKKLNDQFGGGVVTNTEDNLDKIEISSDKKTATVSVRSIFKVGTEKVLMIKMTSNTTETFVKRNGKLLRLRAEGQTLIE
nr:hypothetical protein [uncultured Rhodoferax sp.]